MMTWSRTPIRSKLEQSLSSEQTARHSTRESTTVALETTLHEKEKLVTMRLRDQIDDVTFDIRRAEILNRQAQLRLQLERPQNTTEHLMTLIDQAMDFSARASALLREGSVVGRRQILQAIGSNWTIEEKKPLYLAKSPFSLMTGATASSSWWRRRDSNSRSSLAR